MLGLMSRNDEIAVIGIRGLPNVQGGVEKHCEALYPRIKDMRFRVYRRNPYISDRAEGKFPNIKFSDLPSGKTAGLEAVVHTLLASVSCAVRRPALVHVHNIGPGLFIPLLRLFGLKTVMTYHSSNYEHAKWSAPARALLRMAEWLSMRFSNKVIFVNKRMYDKLSLRYPGKSVFLPNGVNRATPSTATDYVESLGVKPGEYLLAVGRLTPEKGFEYLIDAVNALDRDVRLVIAGGSDNADTYHRMLQSRDVKGRVIFTGNLQGEPLRQLYSHARAYVLSSVNEGFPLVLLEAMQMRLPVIASDIPATRLPGVTRFFRSADSADLSRVLEEYLSASAPGERVDYDMTPYDWDVIARQTEAVYRSLEH